MRLSPPEALAGGRPWTQGLAWLLPDGMSQRFASETDFKALCMLARNGLGHDSALALAWALRQVDSALAARLAQQCLKAFEPAQAPAAAACAWLVLAEAAWLSADSTSATASLQHAGQLLQAAGCSRALSDLHWLRSQLAAEAGDRAERDAAIQASIECARAAGDTRRERYGLLAQACLQTMDEAAPLAPGDTASLAELVEQGLGAADPGERMLAHLQRQHRCSQLQQAEDSMRHGEQAHLAALACGQWRRALLVRCNQGLELYDLQALEEALSCLEGSLPLARQCGWPLPLAALLHATAQCLCALERHDAAQAFAREALALIAQLPRSRVHMLLQLTLAEALLGTPQDAGQAQQILQDLLQMAQAVDDQAILRTAWYGMARALMLQAQPQAAWPLAQASMEQACKGGDIAHAVQCLRLQARLAALPALQPAGLQPPRALLEQACALLPGQALGLQHELLAELAQAQASEGDARTAHETWHRAYLGLKNQRSQAFMLHAAAMEVRLRTEQAQLEARQQRAKAQDEHQRAAALDLVNSQLQQALAELHATQAQLLARNQALDAAYRRINELSLTDPLTQLNNRRFFDTVIENSAEEALAESASGKAMLFLMVDLDRFKQVNDAWGHDAGDAVLVQFAQRLRAVARGQDHLVRWGGEEFLLLLRHAAPADAAGVAERLLKVASSEPFLLPGGQRLFLSCSVGYCAFPPERSSTRTRRPNWREALAEADARLFQAKRAGRNRAQG